MKEGAVSFLTGQDLAECPVYVLPNSIDKKYIIFLRAQRISEVMVRWRELRQSYLRLLGQ